MTNIVAIQDVRKALQAKKEHLESIFELTEQQDVLIQALDVVGLMDNLNVRQEHIEAVEDLEKGLPDRRTLLMSHDCARLAVEINTIVDRIQQLDTLNQQKARDCLTFLKGQSKKISEGRRAGFMYDQKPNDVGATYFDLKK